MKGLKDKELCEYEGDEVKLANVLLRENVIPNITLYLKSPSELNLEYKVLREEDEELLLDAAECLAETFAGTEVEGRIISEPMATACGLSREDMFEFVVEYLKISVDDGLTYIAIDKASGRVVGVVACENFNPAEEVPIFEGNLAPMNELINFLMDIDVRFIETIEHKTGKSIEKGEYVHAFMAGSRLGKFKSYVVAKLVEHIIDKGMEKGYKGVFGEATNIRSAKVLTDYHDFHLVYDKDNQPILKEYASVETFSMIPEKISKDCRILYRPLKEEYDI